MSAVNWVIVTILTISTRIASGEKAVLFSTGTQNIAVSGDDLSRPVSGNGRGTQIDQWGFSTFSSWVSSQDGWVFDENFGSNGRFYVCDTQVPGVENWLKSPYIETKRSSRIEVKIMYAQVPCTKYPLSNPDCKNELTLHYLEASGPDDNRQLDAPKYTKSSRTISADSFLEDLGDRDDDKVYAYFDLINLRSDTKGIFLLIGDQGSCSVIHSVELTYFVCSEQHNELVRFPETVVGQMDKEVYGHCVADASRSNPPRATCRFYGAWEFHKEISENCACNAGFEPTTDVSSCKPCDAGTYKASNGNHYCSVCPMNSYAKRTGSTECKCKDRFYRGKNDSADSACEQPPPPPRDLMYEMKNTVVTLSWSAPTLPHLYQRRNICYQISCRRCPPSVMESFTDQCTYATQVTLYDLEPETDYIIDVYSANSITKGRVGLQNHNSIQIKTGKLARVTDLTVNRIGRQGVELTWNCDADALLANHQSSSGSSIPLNSPGSGEGVVNKTNGGGTFSYHSGSTGGNTGGRTYVAGSNFDPSADQQRRPSNAGGNNLGYSTGGSSTRSDLGDGGRMKTSSSAGGNMKGTVVVFEVRLSWKGQPHAIFTTSSFSYATTDLEPGFWGFQVCVEGVKSTCSEVVNKEILTPEIGFDLRHIIALAGIGTTIVVLIIITMILSVWCIRNNLASPSPNAYRGAEQLKWASSSGPHFYHGAGAIGNQYVSNHSPDYNSSVGVQEDWMLSAGMHQQQQQMGGMGSEQLPSQMIEEWGVQHIQLSRIEFAKNETPSFPNGLPDLIKARLSDHSFSQTCMAMIKQATLKSYSDLGLIAHEVATCAQFQHPNVLYLYGIALNGPEMLITLEYTGKGTLDRLIRDMSPPNGGVGGLGGLGQVVHLLRGVASGMQFFADLGYVHKVLTSENVYVTDSDVCKIAGFDTRAVLEAEEAENVNCTVFNALVPWLAPEVSAGIGNAQCRHYSLMSDVWSFGVLIWECLSAEKPFGQTHPHEIIRAITCGYRLPVPKATSGSPGPLSGLMMGCWNENPLQRPSFHQIHSTLEKLISNPTLMLEQTQSATVQNETPTLSYLNLNSSPVEASQKLKQASTTSVCGTENPNGTFNSPPYTPMTSIEEWLQHINMDHCVPNLKKGQDKNYMTIGDVIHIDGKTLKSLGICNQDRKVILKSLQSMASSIKPQLQPQQKTMKSFKNEHPKNLGLNNIAHSII